MLSEETESRIRSDTTHRERLLLAEIDRLRHENDESAKAMNAENDRHIERIAALEAELAAARESVATLTRKGESLCCQNGNLLVEKHDLEQQLTSAKGALRNEQEIVHRLHCRPERLNAGCCERCILMVEALATLPAVPSDSLEQPNPNRFVPSVTTGSTAGPSRVPCESTGCPIREPHDATAHRSAVVPEPEQQS